MKKLLTFLTLLMLFFTTAGATESLYYTLDGNQSTGGNASPHNSYTAAAESTQNGITWSIMGNSNQTPWRIGGKNISQVDRPVTSLTAMGSAISKVELEVGDITLTSCYVRLIVASDEDFNDIIETVIIDGKLSANETYTFTPSTSTEWATGSYYKFVFVCTNTSNSNKYVQFKSAKFYKNDGSTPSGPDYYLVGSFNMDGNNWVQQDANYKFNKTGDNSYSLSAGNLPDDVEFKIIKVDGGATTWYGGSVSDGQPYALTGTWHTDIPLKDNPNYGQSIQNFKMSVGGVSNFTLNTSDMTFTVEKTTPQFYFKSSADWTLKEAMTSTADGWTITKDCAAGINFGFNDEWTWYGRDNYWITDATVDKEIDLSNDGTFYIEKAGIYTFTVNNAKTKLVVTKAPEYVLVTGTDGLEDGAEYVLMSASSGSDGHAMAPYANGNNCPQTSSTISITDNKITPTVDTQIITLIATTVNNEDAWMFKVGSDSYLYAASSSSNHLKAASASTAGNNGKATISFSDGAAVITFKGSNTHNLLRYNSGSSIFSCYTSGQNPVYLFKKAENNTSRIPEISPEGGNIVGFSQEVEITQANGGIIYYTTDGTTPTETSTQYNGKFWIEGENLGDEITVTAVAKEGGKELSSPVSATYTFVAPVKPTFTPAPGTYPVAQSVSMSTTTTGADVYYTTNSELSYTEIVAQGTKFTQAIDVSEETTFYAVAAYYDEHAQRYAISSITQAKYKFAEVEYVDLDYTHAFTGGTGFGDFTFRTDANPDNVTVWTVSSSYGAKATSYTSNPNTNHVATSWMLSPYINLDADNVPILTFDHQINKHFDNPKQQATVWIQSYGGEWKQLETSLPLSSDGIDGWPKFNEEYDLSAYKGQIIRIGFKYMNETSTGAGTWEIQNFSVADVPIVEVNNIAEFIALENGTRARFKNPVTVLYDYSQYSYSSDYIRYTYQEYIWVKDESGYTQIFLRPSLDENKTTTMQTAFYENGDVIPAGFVVVKNHYDKGNYDQAFSNQGEKEGKSGFKAATQKALADPEPFTAAKLAALEMTEANEKTYSNRYISINKIKITRTWDETKEGKILEFFEFAGDDGVTLTNVDGFNKFNDAGSHEKDGTSAVVTRPAAGETYYNVKAILSKWDDGWQIMPIEFIEWVDKTVTLRELCADGDVGTVYTISNNLMCVYANGNSIWVKDDTGQSIWPATPADGDLNFEVYAEAAEGIVANTRLNQAYYDQSNWCEIKLADGVDASQFEGQIIKGGTIRGEFTDKLNPTLENVTLTSAAISSEGDYALNYYMPANFLGRQECFNPNHSTDYGQNYFFMTPKPQEYAQIVWAVWDASTTSMIMSTDDNKNGHRFAGEFEIDLSMNDGASSYSDITSGATYNFTAIIKRTNSKAEGYKVYPLDLNGNNPATGINTVETGNGEVKSIKYVNVAGIVSDKPFQGVNIVVTEYTDGSRTTSKMLRK